MLSVGVDCACLLREVVIEIGLILIGTASVVSTQVGTYLSKGDISVSRGVATKGSEIQQLILLDSST